MKLALDQDEKLIDSFVKQLSIYSKNENKILYYAWINTKLGKLIAICDERALYLLEFIEKGILQRELKKLVITHQAKIIKGQAAPIDSIKKELNAYFKGTLVKFNTPLYLTGTDFQKQAWKALIRIPYGKTRSYLEQATIIGNEKAFRAVANANGANMLSIIIPCHRIINTNGNLGGYAGGLDRKQWLLDHEKKYFTNRK